MQSFFFRELQLITVLLLIRDSYMSWSTSFDSLKVCVGVPIFDFLSFLLIFFVQQKSWTSLTLKRRFDFFN